MGKKTPTRCSSSLHTRQCEGEEPLPANQINFKNLGINKCVYCYFLPIGALTKSRSKKNMKEFWGQILKFDCEQEICLPKFLFFLYLP